MPPDAGQTRWTAARWPGDELADHPGRPRGSPPGRRRRRRRRRRRPCRCPCSACGAARGRRGRWPARATRRNSGGTGHEPSSTRASTPAGSTRGRFSGSPPPVMWASALTVPVGQRRRAARRGSCGAARAGPRRAGGRSPAGVTSIGIHSNSRAQQRVAVGVRAARRHADQHVAGGDVGAGEQRGPLGDADERAGDVERARRVDAGHLGRLAAEQRAAGGLARLGHAGDDLGDEVGVEHAGGDVVEEEQRPWPTARARRRCSG